ncbi:MAG: C-GCAxxG-C-C family protein [Candidatus Gastranaerophilaceae bacterium]
MLKSSDYSEKGRKLFKEGYNCAQSVFCTFAEEIGMDFNSALKLSSSFGGGMGRLREVCGAVSAIFMIAGIKYGYTTPNDDKTKAEHYTRIQKLADKFKEKHKTIICRELLGLDVQTDSPIPSKRTEEYYQTRPCEELIANACEIIADYIKEQETCKL